MTTNTANHNVKVFEVFKNLKTYGYDNEQFDNMSNYLGVRDTEGIYLAGLIAVLVSPYQACEHCRGHFTYNNELAKFFEEFIEHNVDKPIPGLINGGRLMATAEIATITKMISNILGESCEELFNEEFYYWIENQQQCDNSDLY